MRLMKLLGWRFSQDEGKGVTSRTNEALSVPFAFKFAPVTVTDIHNRKDASRHMQDE